MLGEVLSKQIACSANWSDECDRHVVNGLVDWPKFAHFCICFRGVLTKDPIQSELLLENFEANSYGLIPRLSSRCLAADQLLARRCQAWAPLGRGYRGTGRRNGRKAELQSRIAQS